MNINRKPLKVARFLKLSICNGKKVVSTITPDDVDNTQTILHPIDFIEIVKSNTPRESLTCCLYLDDIIEIINLYGVTYESI